MSKMRLPPTRKTIVTRSTSWWTKSGAGSTTPPDVRCLPPFGAEADSDVDGNFFRGNPAGARFETSTITDSLVTLVTTIKYPCVFLFSFFFSFQPPTTKTRRVKENRLHVGNRGIYVSSLEDDTG